MTTLVQLLANYYKSVVESERIYYENVIRKSVTSDTSDKELREPSPRMLQEMLLLQRQIGQLTVEIQVLRKENDTLKELQKTQRALMESKLNNCKKTIEKLKKNGKDELSEQRNSNLQERDRANFHLLSPLNVRTLDGVSTQNHYANSNGRPTSLRHVITNKQQTLFDGDDSRENLSADRLEDVAFVNSLKNRGELAKIVLPSDGLSVNDDSVAKSTSTSLQSLSGRQLGNKKKRLARKRIKTGDSESDDEDVIKHPLV
ncbi:hypothetical protein HG535_0D05190 [Zygotorulaspora mrakii]|uniref:Uncharacterized protein n=1 Tax=Zygotorulaspora mrakii TaxID=42260 RepID=A0A7H9B2G9_ZYGMR|nr:uncharacterized protein HG535_0D05190 [Zygotorulaspora mrakii]QLG72810.1 hypothetical protein HG535_0D05190 [Zygotorulaspora mrakii]